MLWPGPYFRAGLLVVSPVALDKSCLKCLDNHRRRFVETSAGFVHAEAEGLEFAPSQTSPKSEPESTITQQVENGSIFRDT